MYNMSIPTQLKSWIDFLTRAGRTFKPVDRTNFEGLIDGKKIYVILSRGGDYSQAPSSAFDFQEPLVRASLGLLGMNDVNFIRAEGQRLEEAPFYMKSAREAIARLAS
jgi:FMN-dependent NADH-azoreductase